MKEESKKLIKKNVLCHYFCNVDEEGWPEDPLNFLDKYDDGSRSWGDGIIDNVSDGFGEGDEGYRRMEVWEPFVSRGNLWKLVNDSIEQELCLANAILHIEAEGE